VATKSPGYFPNAISLKAIMVTWQEDEKRMWKSFPSACPMCPASNCPSSWDTATRGTGYVLSHRPEGEPGTTEGREKGKEGRREAKGPAERKAPSRPSFLQTVLVWGKSQSYPTCSPHTSSIFPPFSRCLSLSYSLTNTGKTVPHLFFPPQFRRHPPTLPRPRSPCFRFPSSCNSPFCPFLTPGGVRHTLQSPHAQSPPLSKAFVTLHAMTSPEWSVRLQAALGHAMLNVVLSLRSTHSQVHLRR